MNDLIYRQTAINMLCSKCTVDKPETCSTIQKGDNWCEEVYTLQRVPSAQPEEVIPVSWIEAKIERLMMAGDAFNGLSASIIRVMLNEWKREQKGGPK